MDLKKYAASVLHQSVYVPLLNAFTDAYAKEVQPYLTLLQNVRNKDVDNREVKASTIKMLGFDFETDNFTDAQLTSLIEILVRFQSTRGSSAFFQLLGWVKDVPFKLIPLWTSDYKDFSWQSTNVDALSVVKGGEYWPTNRVDLLYDVSTGIINREDIEKMFYEVAPAELVLNQVVGAINIVARDPSNAINDTYNTGEQGTPEYDEDGNIVVPDPDDYPGGEDDPDYKDAIEKLKARTDTIFVWQNVPAFFQQANVAYYENLSTLTRGVVATSGSVLRKFTGQQLYSIDQLHTWNGSRRGINYVRDRRLVRYLYGTKDQRVVNPNTPYYSREGWLYSTAANTNIFLNSTQPKSQSLELQAGVWTIWNRGYGGSLKIDFGNDIIIEQATNQQNTFELTQAARVIIIVEPGITFVQVEPVEMRTQGIYTLDQPGTKPDDHYFVDIASTYSMLFDFKLMYSDYVMQNETYKAVFSYGDFIVECKLGVNVDRLDSTIRVMHDDAVVQEGLLSSFSQASAYLPDGFTRLECKIMPNKVQFNGIDYNVSASRVWFGSDQGRRNCPLFIDSIIMLEEKL